MNTKKYITGVLLASILWVCSCSKYEWWNGKTGNLTNKNLPYVSCNVDSTSDSSITLTVTTKVDTTVSTTKISAQGVCWSTSPNPTINDYKLNSSTNSPTTFSLVIAGLKPKMTYYLRGFAINHTGVGDTAVAGYSSQITITTPAYSPYTFGQIMNGSMIFYIDTTGQHGLVCDTADLTYSVTETSGKVAIIDSFPWSVSNRNRIFLSNGTAIGTDGSNTQAILVAFDSLNSPNFDTLHLPNIAASICRSSHGGDTTWYLPTKDALYLMYKNLAARGYGNFSKGSYWSSSDYILNGKVYAWAQYFGNVNQYYFNQSSLLYVRGVKKF